MMNFGGQISRDQDEADSMIAGGGRGRRRWLRIAFIVAAVLICILVLSRLLSHGKSDNPQTAAASGGSQSVPAVSVMIPGRAQVAGTISATGTLAARREMPVGVAGEGGEVAQVLVDAGDWVKAGQTLATIDQSVQVRQAEQLAAQIKAAQANAALAQSELDRAQKLVARGFISKADIDTKTATRDAARAQVQVAEAELGQTRAQIARLDIRAPASGLVLTRGVESGQVVSSGSTALFRIAKDGEMEMMARVAESDLAHLRVGQPATVTPVGGTSAIIGQIWQLAPIIDPTTRQGYARIALHYNPALRPGGFATAEINSGALDAPQLPQSAVLADDRGNYVYVVGSDQRVQRRDVKVGEVSQQGIVITAGLTGREQVVVSAGPFLNPGDRIKPQRVAAHG